MLLDPIGSANRFFPIKWGYPMPYYLWPATAPSFPELWYYPPERAPEAGLSPLYISRLIQSCAVPNYET